VIPASFEYVRAASVDEALDRLSSDAEAKVIAGGHSLIPLMRFRLAQPSTLVDIGGLRDLAGIGADGDGWRIGALTTYRELLDHAELLKAYPLLAECVESIGDVQVRNRGTIGGALAHCDPASDLPAAALALDGEVILRSHGGERAVPLTDFFLGPFTTAMEPTELLVALRLPTLPGGAGTAWVALEQAASGYSMVGVAAIVGDTHGVYGSAKMDHVRVAITGVADAPYRATAVEDALVGTDCNVANLAGAANHATEGRTVSSDIHADAEYRASLAVTLVRRALERARARTG
jgi:carbon-monoxide dehydrogenase medium subunit